MKFLAAILVAAIALSTAAAPEAAIAANVRVELSGLRAGGKLYVQAQTRDQFLGEARAAGRVIQAPQAGAMIVDLGEIPPGDYAVTVWHDDNGNGRFDIDSASGRPLDGLVSLPNQSGPPSFEQVKVAVPASGLTVPLALQYGR